MFSKVIIQLMIAVISLISLSIHEFSHGYVAYRLGDDTAKNMGRLTINPLKHVDWLGLVCLIIFKLGWAKPVPVNPYRLKTGTKGMFIVALSGPASNVCLAILSSFLYKYSYYLFIRTYSIFADYASIFFYLAVVVNIGYAIFNLIPIPPLDGSRLLFLCKNRKLLEFVSKYERYSFIFIFVLLQFGFYDYVISPVINYIVNILV